MFQEGFSSELRSCTGSLSFDIKKPVELELHGLRVGGRGLLLADLHEAAKHVRINYVAIL